MVQLEIIKKIKMWLIILNLNYLLCDMLTNHTLLDNFFKEKEEFYKLRNNILILNKNICDYKIQSSYLTVQIFLNVLEPIWFLDELFHMHKIKISCKSGKIMQQKILVSDTTILQTIFSKTKTNEFNDYKIRAYMINFAILLEYLNNGEFDLNYINGLFDNKNDRDVFMGYNGL